MEVEFTELHCKFANPKGPMVLGVAVNTTAGLTPGTTVTVAAPTAVPPGPVAVPVKFVVAVSLPVQEPATATAPTPLSIVTEVALVDVHLSVTSWPKVAVLGLTCSTIVGAGFAEGEVPGVVVEVSGVEGVDVATVVPPPPLPHAKKNIEMERLNNRKIESLRQGMIYSP
jgi:hypothetical protein